MIILISNDDGVHSPGLHALVRAVADLGQVWVVAPDREQSAVGHSITIAEPIRLTDMTVGGAFRSFAVSGSPADCVKLALSELLPETPALVISGINRGENTGISIIYSGTVSAATEGAINGIPAMAVSLDSFTHEDFGPSAAIARRAAQQALADGMPEGTLLNVNVPALPTERIRGIKVIRQGQGRFKETFLKRNDPRGRTYYWMDGHKLPLNETDTDGTALTEGYVAVTPIHFDLTNHAALQQLGNWSDLLLPLANS
ncbi:MAG: 5'/3'-nucleotidase SurE [Calditrichaeota bacterium]|nr:5'/3'-nucleotidase SurE [Calditrichota bacterium]MCB9368161.1 5'/3'-nucleotidase SurE [Calditrichota bacterium]